MKSVPRSVAKKDSLPYWMQDIIAEASNNKVSDLAIVVADDNTIHYSMRTNDGTIISNMIETPSKEFKSFVKLFGDLPIEIALQHPFSAKKIRSNICVDAVYLKLPLMESGSIPIMEVPSATNKTVDSLRAFISENRY